MSLAKLLKIIIIITVVIVPPLGLYIGCPILFLSTESKAEYIEAKNLELTRVYPKAITLYQQIIEKYPDSHYVDNCRLGIANCLGKQGNFDEAYEKYDDLLKNSKATEDKLFEREILLNYAEISVSNGDIPKAKELFQRLVDEHPGSQEAIYAGENLNVFNKDRSRTASKVDVKDAKVVLKDFTYPEKLSAGESGKLIVRLENLTDRRLSGLNLQIDLEYFKGMEVVKIDPEPFSTQEYWGKRIIGYSSIEANEIAEIVINVKAVEDAAGSYSSALSVEANLEDTGIYNEFTTVVE